MCPAPTLHERDALERLKGAQQNASAHAGFFARYVHHEAGSIREIHIGVAAAKKERANTGRLAAERMSRRIADRVRFGLNDASAEPPLQVVVDQRLADQVPRQLDGVSW